MRSMSTEIDNDDSASRWQNFKSSMDTSVHSACSRCPPCCYSTIQVPPLIEMAGTYFDAKQIPKWFVALRSTIMVLMLYILAMALYVKADKGEIEWFLIWLTNWTLIVLVITVIVRFSSTIYVLTKIPTDRLSDPLEELTPALRLLHHNQHVLMATGLSATSVVALNYWAFTYDPSDKGTTIQQLHRVQVHGINALLMWVDYLLSAERMRWKSIMYPCLFGILYAIWSIIFDFTIEVNEDGDHYIYSFLDWSEGVTEPLIFTLATVVLLSLFTALGVFTKNMILIKTKEKWAEKCDDNDTSDSEQNNQTPAVDAVPLL